MSPFQPLGDAPRWQVLYSLLEDLAPGDVLTYAEMATALDIPESARHIMQNAIRRAAREFEVSQRHALEPVPNIGYRVVSAGEHVTLARSHQKKAGKSLVRGHSKVVNVDLSGMDVETKHAFGVMAQAFSAQMDFIRRMDVRQKKLEEAVNSIVTKTERTDDEVAELRRRLERLEKPD